MEFFQVIQERRSIRAFASCRPVEMTQVQTILNAACRAPSAGNLQAYEVYVITNRTSLDALARAALDQMFIAEAPLALVFCASPLRSLLRYGRRGAVLFCLQDASIACAYAELAVTALGLAGVWVGSFHEDLVREVIGAGKGLVPIAILAIGYGREIPSVRSRRPLSEWTHYLG